MYLPFPPWAEAALLSAVAALSSVSWASLVATSTLRLTRVLTLSLRPPILMLCILLCSNCHHSLASSTGFCSHQDHKIALFCPWFPRLLHNTRAGVRSLERGCGAVACAKDSVRLAAAGASSSAEAGHKPVCPPHLVTTSPAQPAQGCRSWAELPGLATKGAYKILRNIKCNVKRHKLAPLLPH